MPDIAPTERLYFADAFLSRFEARVVAVTEWHGQPAVILDATAFYPEGGGQPADRGTLGGIAVVDMQEHDDIILHVLAEPLPAQPGARVAGEVDWQRRFDHMQQHTGQHTLSGAFHRLLGAQTRSWHLGAEYVTIEVDRMRVSDAAVAEAEHAANEVIWRDVPVSAGIYAQAELAALDLRTATERSGDVRVVSIGDWDRIACGGTHVASSGQVGAITVRRWEPHADAARIEFVCGARALRDARANNALLDAAGAALKAGRADLPEQVQRLLAQASDLREEAARLRRRLVEYEVRDTLAAPTRRLGGRPVVRARRDDWDPADLRALAQHVAHAGGVALVGGVAAGKAHLIFACDRSMPLDVSRLLQMALPAVEGRGGGQPFQAQGGGPNTDGLDAALDTALDAVMRSA